LRRLLKILDDDHDMVDSLYHGILEIKKLGILEGRVESSYPLFQHSIIPMLHPLFKRRDHFFKETFKLAGLVP
jgi:hypothetical protein